LQKKQIIPLLVYILLQSVSQLFSSLFLVSTTDVNVYLLCTYTKTTETDRKTDRERLKYIYLPLLYKDVLISETYIPRARENCLQMRFILFVRIRGGISSRTFASMRYPADLQDFVHHRHKDFNLNSTNVGKQVQSFNWTAINVKTHSGIGVHDYWLLRPKYWMPYLYD